MAELEEGYPLFDWTVGNGAATAEQTQKAYTAAANQGQCADFSRLVWNDIVNSVAALQTALGLSWNEKYTAMNDAKVAGQYDALTAEQFNSVRHNIQAVAYTTWRWQFDYLKEGYTGRNDFRGVATMGKNADVVYGWYIIELVRKLNVAIELMRGTYPVADMNFRYTVASGLAVHPMVRDAVKLTAIGATTSKRAAAVSVAGTMPLTAGHTAKSAGAGHIRTIPIIGLPGVQSACSYERGMVELIGTVPMGLVQESGTAADAAMAPLSAVGFAHSGLYESHTKAQIISSMRSVAFGKAQTARSRSVVAANAGPSGALMAPNTARGYATAGLGVNDLRFLAAASKGVSHALSEFNALGRTLLAARCKADSGSSAAALMREALHFAKHGTIKSSVKNLLLHRNPLPISVARTGESGCKAHLVPGSLRAMRAAACGNSGVVAALDFISTASDWYVPVQTGSNLYIRSAWLPWQDGNAMYIDVAEFYGPVQTGDNLYIRSAWFHYQDQNGAFIDTDVFYAPQRNGSNLHIRSVDRFWRDGSGGNIDTDVFLEPVQDGSNLYIRQNIFGGE